jgi:hypothetical protein
MRRYLQYAVSGAAAVLVLGTVVWANWAAVTADAANHRAAAAAAAISPHEIMRGSTDLPVTTVHEPF